MSKSKRKKKTTMVETTTTLMENALNRSKSRVSPQNDVVQLEKHLPNGDLYTGTFIGNIPHGSGKYLWSDGCMYEGEWKKGKANGNGKFSWPSGATYEGEFKGGRMEGQGTFTGPHGDTYSGSWVGDKKHGYGVKRYANGDCYAGNWKRNLQEGFGNYVWKNGNWYKGEWRGGVICGKGVLSWDHGGIGNLNNSVSISDCRLNVGRIGSENSIVLVSDCKSKLGRDCGFGSDCVSKTIRVGLDVESKTGRVGSGPKLDCEDTMVLDCKMGVGLGPELDCENNLGSDCRMCVGLDPKLECSMCVASFPKLDCENSIGSDCRMCVGKGENSIGSDCKTCVGKGENSVGSDCDMSVVGKGDIVLDCNMSIGKTSNVGLFPRICIWESEGEAGDITCDIIDNVGVASMIYGDGFLGLDRRFVSSGIGGNGVSSSPCCFIKEAKKPGHTISKGHKNYDLMLNLQLGIRYSVGKHSSILRELKPRDFDPKEKFWTRFPPEGSKLTPTHKSTEFRWKDYCPVVFRHLRDLFQVDPADYMLAVCGNDALRELSSPGKSGSFFYLTQDDRFMIKTVKKSEVKVLLRMLPSYYQHVYRYENTLVTRFYGVHCVKPAGGAKTRFIVMGNLFCSEYRIHRRFDLKGSRHGRTTEKAEGEIDETTTLKDLDLDFVFRLQRNWYQELIKQIERDCEFLEAERIMDYSLLVGIHFRNDNTGDKMGLSPFVLRGKKASYQNEKYLRGQRFLAAELQDMDRVLAGRKPLIRLGANMPARAERLARRSDFDQYVPGGSGNLMPSRNGEIYEIILYFGIIDILQDYDITKRLEHAYKSLQADPTSISAVDPQLYSKRFRDFIGRIFVEDR